MKKHLTFIVGILLVLVGLWMQLKDITDGDVYVKVGLILMTIYTIRIFIVYIYNLYKQK